MTAPTTEEVLASVDPDLHSMIREFLRKSKHVLSIEQAYMYFSRQEGDEIKTYYSGVRFYDNSAKADEVGGIRIDRRGKGKPVYEVRTRHVINSRFKNSERKRTVETTDAKRAMKAMLQYITPFTLDEVFKDHESTATGVVTRWRSQLQEDVSALSVPRSAMVTEMQNLIRQGVKFITPEFNLVAEKALAANEETQRRMGAKVTKHFVSMGNNQIAVLTVHHDNTRVSNFYRSFESMPMLLQEGVAMLRIMQDHQHIDGFGARISENMFVVLEIDGQKA
jgi:hypothetical protein